MQDGEQDRLSGEPFSLVGLHHAARMTVARIVGVGEQGADMIAPSDVAVLRFLEQAREQRQSERMAAEIMRGRLQVAVDAPDVIVAQEFRAGLVRQPADIDDRRAVLEALDIGDGEAAGQHDQAVSRFRTRGGETAQKRAQALVLEFARLQSRPMLQRLDAVKHEERAPRHQRLGDRLALGGRAGCPDFHAEVGERPVEELVGCRRSLL